MTDEDPESLDSESTFELLERLFFPEFFEEDWEEAYTELQAQPREPGRFKVEVAGKPEHFEWEGVCSDCGKILKSQGIRFAKFPCSLHPELEDCIAIHIHWSSDCPKLRHRIWRFWNIHTWGKVDNRWKSWKWQRQSRKERKDPNAWIEYWKGKK